MSSYDSEHEDATIVELNRTNFSIVIAKAVKKTPEGS